MPPLSLRPAVPADGPAIAAIQLAAWRATYGRLNPALVDGLDLDRTSANWARAAADPARRLRLAESGATAVGYALSGPAESGPDGTGEIDAVYLLPTAQGQGGGRLLVEDALLGLGEAGHGECVVWVVEQNAGARAFYERVGFRPDDGRDTWRGLPVVRYRAATPAVPRRQADGIDPGRRH
ncbi:N-acetyltransferase [Catellatospora sp. TT07R-123]|uniref:GNAT family N-acetyltransferase n=1 Tax=Catellatospora sp. TT07R-123 TaxID=2733863 RepID=UPI001B0EC06C|nr:GNAT family N-acetyltransferase [Catellatospora sp. TT07R-123]GHJ44458.1 N-acetyltransferase [Catellatospora sp. TT07R-123]